MQAVEFLFWYYLLLAAELAVTFAIFNLEYERESPFFLFWGALGLVYVIPSVIDPFLKYAVVTASVQHPQDLRTNPELISAKLFYLAFSGIYWMVRSSWLEPKYRTLPGGFTPRTRRELERYDAALLLLPAIAAAVAAAAAVNFSLHTFLSGTYGSYRVQADTPMRLAANYLAVYAGGCAFLLWQTHHRALAAAAGLCIILAFLAGRTRQLLIPLLVPFVLLAILRLKGAFAYLKLALIGIGGIAFFSLLQAFRYTPSLEVGFEWLFNGRLWEYYFEKVLPHGGETNLRFAYYFFFDPAHHFPGFGEAPDYVRLALFWLPDAVAPNLKPALLDETLFNIFYPGAPHNVAGTVHVLFPGSAYVNFGWLGCVMGGPLAIVAGVLNIQLHRIDYRRAYVMIGPFCLLVMMLARGSVYNTVMKFLVAMACAWALSQLAHLLRLIDARWASKSPAAQPLPG